MSKKNALIHTLGCRLNTADSALLVSRLEEAGYRITDSAPQLDLIVVNSCTVTAEAMRKSRQAVRRFRAEHPQALIVVTGCAAELDREHFLEDGAADVVISNPEKREIIRLILEFLQKHEAVGGKSTSLNQPGATFNENTVSRFPFRSRAFLKIQEGCDNYCTYCIVPYVRGHQRSRDFEEVIADCRKAIEAGFPEIVLTGVNTCAYSDHGKTLEDLIRAVAALDGAFRIRLSSTEPHPDNLGLLEVMASEPKVCRFLHLALQNGSDRILREMNRHYTRAQYAKFVERARELIPDIHIGSDLIVGFPGETEEDFADGLQFVEAMQFANLHIFTYSPRPGTPAAALPGRVSPEVARDRYARMKAAAARSHAAFLAGQCGKMLPVIFERIDRDGFARGWSDNYLELRVPATSVELHKIVKITANKETLTGSDEIFQ